MRQSGTEETGDCYEAAFKFVFAHEQDTPGRYVLVHGNVASLKQDEPVNHAWVEVGDIVHEVSKGRHVELLKSDYYKHHGVTLTRRYSHVEALIESVTFGHYGPWP